MLLIKYKNILLLSTLLLIQLVSGVHAYAASDDVFNKSGLPVPRFVSLANDETNVRAGPGQKYPIKWVINRKGLPVEVILEFEHWRKIKDHDGQEGWVFHTLLSGKRTALINSKNTVDVYEKPADSNGKKQRVSIRLESGVQVNIGRCDGSWCKVEVSGFSGWVERKSLWGVYADENFE